MTSPAPTATWQSLRILSLTLVAAPVAILVALWTVLPHEDAFAPPLWALLVPLAVAGAAVALVATVGYRTEALDPALPSEEARVSAAARFQALMILRFVLCEAIAIASIALAFLVDQGGIAILLVGVALTELLFWIHVVPNLTQVGKVQAALAARGSSVSLREALQAR